MSTALADSGELGLTDQEKQWLSKHTVLRVHNERNWPPFNFNENGKATGMSIDYMNLIATKLNVGVQYVTDDDWEHFFEWIRSGSLDVMLNIVNTPARREFMTFTEPYLISPAGIFVTRDNRSIHSLDDLNGKVVAVTRGFFMEEMLKKNYPGIRLLVEGSTLQNLESVAFGRADATIGIPGVMNYLIDTHFLTNLKLAGQANDKRLSSVMSIGVRKDQTMLRGILQKAMNQVTPQEMKLLYARWNLNAQHQSLPAEMTDEDKQFITNLPSVRVCYQEAAMPYIGKATGGGYQGIVADLMRQLEKQLQVNFQWIELGDSMGSEQALKTSFCDLLPMVTVNSERNSFMRYTSPYLQVPIVLASLHDDLFLGDTSQLKGQTIGYVPGWLGLESLPRRYPDVHFEEVASLDEGVQLMRQGKLDGLADTVPAIAYGMQQYGWSDIKISGRFDEPLLMSMGVSQQKQQLQAVLQKGLLALGDEVPQQIYRQWVSVKYVQPFDFTWVWRSAVGILVILGFLGYRNKQLRRFNRQLERMAVTDALTDLFNRKKLDEILAEEQKRWSEPGNTCGVLLLDLDHFKQVNDHYGHQVGDEVLQRVGQAVSAVVGHGQTLGRWGGEEFMVICPSHSLGMASRLADIIRREVAQLPPGVSGVQTTSIGVAVSQPGETVVELVKRADQALYRAKQEGRNRVAVASISVESMHSDMPANIPVERRGSDVPTK
ncbi:diguanylate cyclase domain-containing protein [Pokkaliibacter sp. CJK22405]|uniref:transporter substrate-binding domain-containing diguanylate cyclase n=1 Tax=Pokkaliibacter sp. CJK22405 TaxID=3384615 RepID=UPI003984E9B9